MYNQISKLVGYESFYKGRMYSYRNINYINCYKEDLQFIHIFKVKSSSGYSYYDVKIYNNGEDIKSFSCNCPQFKSKKTCKHVAAVLINFFSEIVENEIVDELAISKEILKAFKNNMKINKTVREKLDVEIIIQSYGSRYFLKLKIGNKRKYTISTRNKFSTFYDNLTNDFEHYFGRNLTYSSDKHYFDEECLNLFDYIDNMPSNYYNDIFASSKDVLYILKNFRGIKIIFTIDYEDYKINEVKEGLPTNFNLTKSKGNYVLNIDDLKNYIFLPPNNKFIFYKNNIYILKDDEVKYINLLADNNINHLEFGEEYIDEFKDGLLNKIKKNIIIDEKIENIKIPSSVKAKLYFDILYSRLVCKPIFSYDDVEISYFEQNNVLRDNEYESNVIDELLSYGFVVSDKKLVLEDDQEYYYFLDEILNTLALKYEIFTSKKIDDTNFKKNVDTSNNFAIGKDGILSYSFKADGIDEDELSSVFAALKSNKKYYKLKNNSVLNLSENSKLEELNNLITDLELNQNDINSGNAEIPKYRALYIDSLKENVYKDIKTNNLFDEFIRKFKKYKNLKIDFDEMDQKILRDYQKEGVKWLTTIYKCDMGGILADEMGLGKSLQTISFIKQILSLKKDAKIIIVVPTALVYNWQKEFQKFASDLKYVTVADVKSKRKEIFKNRDKYNIFITSFGLVRNDNDEYEKIDFELCVVDEAQNIKNYQAGMTKEIKKIKAKCKIALTGTPVENNITEIWSIFDFIMPGYLHNVLKFREKYNIKDVDEDGIKILKTLNYQISPFILRRKKKDVIKSLPEKIENKVYIDLPDVQKKLYVKVLNDTKKEMDELIKNGGFQKSRMKILQLLTKLRQLCIDPNVLYTNYNGEAIKLEELLRIVKENIANGHKILIFSSFKRVLENVKKMFNNHGISSYTINGDVKSKDRAMLVEAFNKDNTNCFLITLKAGGTGLNLTGADVVIHLDIWWNPAVEDQATDRAHRIGQANTVNVIKLVTNGTIEEKIIELQEKKKILSENLIEGNTSSNNLTSLTEEDIKNLLGQIQ